MVKKLKKQKNILLGKRQLLRNIVFCLNEATLSGIATSLILYQLQCIYFSQLVQGKRICCEICEKIVNLQEYICIRKFSIIVNSSEKWSALFSHGWSMYIQLVSKLARVRCLEICD